MRERAQQSWPALSKTAYGAAAAACSRSASAKITFADLPPSSSVTRLIVPAAPRITCWPTSVEPVKPIFATSGCSISRCPTTEPLPTTTLTTPSGMPGVERELAEPERRQRRQLGRLQHDRVAARERRPELPRRDVEREVPRRDQPDDAERLAERHVDAARDRNRLAVVLVDRARVEVEDLRDHADLAARAGDRLADVARLDPRRAPRGAPRRASRAGAAAAPRSAGATARHAGNAAFARATAASVSSTPADSSSAIGSSVAGFRTIVTRAAPLDSARASATSASKSRASSPASGCQSTPTAKRRSGSSSASTVPSSAHATSRSPSPTRPTPWWWCDFTGARRRRAPSRAASRPRSARRAPRTCPAPRGAARCRRPPAGAARGRRRARRSAPGSRGRPPSTGMSRASAASQQRELGAVALRPQAVRLRVRRLRRTCSGSRSLPPENTSPSSASSVSSTPSVARRHEQRPRAGALDRVHVVVRDQRRVELPVRPSAPGSTYVVMPTTGR